MGSVMCCQEKSQKKQKVKVYTSKRSIEEQQASHILPDGIQTQQSPRKNDEQILETPKSPLRMISFTGYLLQKQVDISEIKLQQSGQDDWCSQQKIFLSYLQRLSKQIETYRKENDPKLEQALADKNHKVSYNEKRFIQHASKCPVCNELYENLKNVEIEQTQKTVNHDFKRKSLRDSLLELVQQQKFIPNEQSTYLNSHSHEQAKKAMKKYPNSNIYQCKRLRFRKTSNFQPEIPQINQSQEATICR